MMALHNNEFLTGFSPSLEYFCAVSRHGHIKVWEISNGKLVHEISQSDDSVEYTCLKWVFCSSKKKRQRKERLVLVIGTQVGDILGVDTAKGKVLWKQEGCHTGAVKTISSASKDGAVYSSGADGIVCKLSSKSGELLSQFKVSKKAVSCLAIAPDGCSLVTASSDLRLFSLEDNRKLQKLASRPGSVNAMVFTEDGKHLVSSASGNNNVELWSIDGIKNKAEGLSMEKPAISLDCKNFGKDDGGLIILAITEAGIAYLWNSQCSENLNFSKPSIIRAQDTDSKLSTCDKVSSFTILSARLEATENQEDATVLIAYGDLDKPKFQRSTVKYGKDVLLVTSQENEHVISSKGVETNSNNPNDQIGVAEMDVCEDEGMVPEDNGELTMEERLLHLEKKDEEKDENLQDLKRPSKLIPPNADSLGRLLTQALRTRDNILLAQCLSVKDSKVIKNSVSPLSPVDALGLLKELLYMLKSKPLTTEMILPWLRALLLQHASYIMSDESASGVLNSLYQSIETRVSVFQPMVKLSGRLDIILSQISVNGDEEHTEQPTVIYEEDEDEDEEQLPTVLDLSESENGYKTSEDELVNSDADEMDLDS